MAPITTEIHVAAASVAAASVNAVLVTAVAGHADGSVGARCCMATRDITTTSNVTKLASTTAQSKYHIGTTNPDHGCEWHWATAGITTSGYGARERLGMAASVPAAAAAGRAIDARSAKRILDVLGWYQVRSTKQGSERASFGARVQGLEQAASTPRRAIVWGAFSFFFFPLFPCFPCLLLSRLSLSRYHR